MRLSRITDTEVKGGSWNNEDVSNALTGKGFAMTAVGL